MIKIKRKLTKANKPPPTTTKRSRKVSTANLPHMIEHIKEVALTPPQPPYTPTTTRHGDVTAAPFFANVPYCIKTATTDSTLTLDFEDVRDTIVRAHFNVTLCLVHGIKLAQVCKQCESFSRFPCTFVLNIDQRIVFTIMQPSLFTQKNFNCFRQFIHSLDRIRNQQLPVDQTDDLYRAQYKQFMNIPLKLGDFDNISSGKLSFVRNKILGFPTIGARMTLTIDCSLPPHYASISETMYRKLQLATPFAIVNRSPSINARCIYVVELVYHAVEADDTIHISPFLTEGMHADQDGDELTVFILQKNTNYGGSTVLRNAIAEMRENSWAYGRRHDLMYQPKYSMTQYHLYLLHYHDEYFLKNSALWRALSRVPTNVDNWIAPPTPTPDIGSTTSTVSVAAAAALNTPRERCKLLMSLGCSILQRELDDFIRQLITFSSQLPIALVPLPDVLSGRGMIWSVVESGAKGSVVHIDAYINNLYGTQPDFNARIHDNFDNYINANTQMGINGGRQFNLLYALNSMVLHQDSIYINSYQLLANVHKSPLFASMFYNTCAVAYTFNQLI